MAFKITKKENLNFNSPQEMYADYKSRTINGPLHYQSDMIDLYMKDAVTESDVAIELPTGSGKTLIGLLIGEYRRRKNKEKVVYVCPTNQLVYQVTEQAMSKYGIKVNPFTGRIKEYSPQSKTEYYRCEAIAVTNYSSIFNNSTFFNDTDIIILDDAHSSEDYIASFWTLDISRKNHNDLYTVLVENIRDIIEPTQYYRMTDDNPMPEDKFWVDIVPNTKIFGHLREICSIIDEYVKETDLKYTWVNLRNHLQACNIYISWNQIVIRPVIPPTLTHAPFATAKQRIYMSATLGKSGELERITGIQNIFRLPMVNDWDKKGLGRRFFMFPNASFQSDDMNEVLLKINKTVNRTLVLVPDNQYADKITKSIKENSDTQVFSSKDIETSKTSFISSKDAIAILANRFDGIDLSGEECRMLIVMDLPKATHLQEKFLITRMAASVLFNERIKTRIVQAIGRCTRSPVDYSAVCIIGEDIMNELISPKKLEQYHVELQAEIDFGFQQSTGFTTVDEFLENLKLFIKRGDEWKDAEEDIINKRDERISNVLNKKDKSDLEIIFEKLLLSAKYEVKYQYAIWRNDHEQALQCVEDVIRHLDAPALRGYKGFWCYLGGYIAYHLYNEGKKTFADVSKKYFRNASYCTNSVSWFSKLIPDREPEKVNEDSLVGSITPRIEKQILQDGLRNNNKFEERAKKILDLLNSSNGNNFERGHQELGLLLGYISNNANGDADPDPWWIINEDICIVAEDKIYETQTKPIPVKHVRQAAGHVNWIKEKIKGLSNDAEIITIMLTNTSVIEEAAAIHGKEIWYVNREVFCQWALKAIEAIRKLRRNFIEEGNIEWRTEAEETLNELKVTPKHFLDLVKSKKLDELPKQ